MRFVILLHSLKTFFKPPNLKFRHRGGILSVEGNILFVFGLFSARRVAFLLREDLPFYPAAVGFQERADGIPKARFPSPVRHVEIIVPVK